MLILITNEPNPLQAALDGIALLDRLQSGIVGLTTPNDVVFHMSRLYGAITATKGSSLMVWNTPMGRTSIGMKSKKLEDSDRSRNQYQLSNAASAQALFP